jgi:hypothetical protein
MKTLFAVALVWTALAESAFGQQGVFHATLSYETAIDPKPTQMSGTALLAVNDQNALSGVANVDFASKDDFVNLWKSTSPTDRGEWFWLMSPLASYTRPASAGGATGWTFNMREPRLMESTMIADLNAGHYWIEVQSAKNPTEIIRGQILPATVPEPPAFALLVLGAFACWSLRRARIARQSLVARGP